MPYAFISICSFIMFLFFIYFFFFGTDHPIDLSNTLQCDCVLYEGRSLRRLSFTLVHQSRDNEAKEKKIQDCSSGSTKNNYKKLQLQLNFAISLTRKFSQEVYNKLQLQLNFTTSFIRKFSQKVSKSRSSN